MTTDPMSAGHGDRPRPDHDPHRDEHHEHGDHGDHGDHQRAGGPGAVWDERYAGMDWPTDPDRTLVELVSSLEPGRAVDLGCGPGRNAIWLARHGWRVTGVDASAVGLAQARERAGREGVSLELVHADLLSYVPPPASFELVVVANLHFAPGDREQFFARATAALAPGGHLYVVGHHLDSLGRAGPPLPERLYSEELLGDLLAPLTVEVRRHERPAGDGGSPLVDAVAWASAPESPGASR